MDRAIKAVKFVEARKGKCFDSQDLADAIGLHRRHAREWLDTISCFYPISTVKEATNAGFGKGAKSALYRVEQ